MKEKAIVVERTYRVPAEKVRRAVTEPALIRRWERRFSSPAALPKRSIFTSAV
jgi:uncharacterized protein YndB with AHSA1/START domain